MTEETQTVDLKDKVVGKIDLPTIDLTKHIGQKAHIDLIEEKKGKYGYFIKVSTNVVERLNEGSEHPIELRGTRLFTLHSNKEGKLGWCDDTKLGAFLNKMKVNHYNELAQKEVILQTKTSVKDNKDYLTFI